MSDKVERCSETKFQPGAPNRQCLLPQGHKGMGAADCQFAPVCESCHQVLPPQAPALAVKKAGS